MKKKTPCVCPTCGAEHTMEIFWTGKLPARKMCPKTCKSAGGKLSHPLAPKGGGNKVAPSRIH